MDDEIRTMLERLSERTIRSETKIDAITHWQDRHDDKDDQSFAAIDSEIALMKKTQNDNLMMVVNELGEMKKTQADNYNALSKEIHKGNLKVQLILGGLTAIVGLVTILHYLGFFGPISH